MMQTSASRSPASAGREGRGPSWSSQNDGVVDIRGPATPTYSIVSAGANSDSGVTTSIGSPNFTRFSLRKNAGAVILR